MKLNRTIAIIGGGASGALTAYHLIRRGAQAQVILIDPHTDLGLGLAYSTPSYRHLLNVPAGKISALPDQPNHFLDWIHKNYDASMTEADFAPRAVFGRYIQSLLTTVTNIDHRQTAVLDCHLTAEQATLDLADGTRIVADAVVLATGNFDPAPLRGVAEETVSNETYCHSAWKQSTYAKLSPGAAVALIGSGLTAVDVVLRLRELGHQGQIVAITRGGTFPTRHAGYEALDFAPFEFRKSRHSLFGARIAKTCTTAAELHECCKHGWWLLGIELALFITKYPAVTGRSGLTLH